MLDEMTNLAGLLKDPDLLATKGYLAGDWVDGASGDTFDVTNPARGDVIAQVADFNRAQAAEAIAVAQAAQKEWAARTGKERSVILRKWYDLMMENAEDLALILTTEMGKPIAQSRAEIEKCAWVCEYYAQEAESHLRPISIASDATGSYAKFEPLGVIFGVMPWNFPFWQLFRFAAPTLMAGNTVLFKHAPNVVGCGNAIESLFSEAFAERILGQVVISIPQVEGIVANPAVKAVSLTGSEQAGSSFASLAGKYLKKSVLELGGSDPFVVFNSANLDLALDQGLKSRILNNGQSCIAAKRFLVQKGIYSDFKQRLVDSFASLKVGNPLDESVDVGPLARADLKEKLASQVQELRDLGGEIVFQATSIPENGCFYPPTIIEIPMQLGERVQEEFFGPVAILIAFETIDDCLRIANSTNFGLGSAVFSNDENEISRLENEINAGAVFVNGMVKSDPRLPFGGIKNSGFGRELGQEGIKEFVNIKTVWRK